MLRGFTGVSDKVLCDLQKAPDFHKLTFERAVDSIRTIAATHLWQVSAVFLVPLTYDRGRRIVLYINRHRNKDNLKVFLSMLLKHAYHIVSRLASLSNFLVPSLCHRRASVGTSECLSLSCLHPQLGCG